MEEKKEERRSVKIGVGFGEFSKGSSTLALLLASYFFKAGKKVALVDADINNYSLSKWRANESDFRLNNEVYRDCFQQEIIEKTPEIAMKKISENEIGSIKLDHCYGVFDYQIYDLSSQTKSTSHDLLRQLDLIVMPIFSRYHSFFQIENLKTLIDELEKEQEDDNKKPPKVVVVNYLFNGNMPIYLVKYLHTFSFVNGFKMFGGFFPYDRSLNYILGNITPQKKTDCVLSTYYGYTDFLSQKTVLPLNALGNYLQKILEQKEKNESSRSKYTVAGSNFKDIDALFDSDENKLINVPETIYLKLKEANKRYDNIGVSNIAVALLETGLNDLEKKTQPRLPSNEPPEEEQEESSDGENANSDQSETGSSENKTVADSAEQETNNADYV